MVVSRVGAKKTEGSRQSGHGGQQVPTEGETEGRKHSSGNL